MNEFHRRQVQNLTVASFFLASFAIHQDAHAGPIYATASFVAPAISYGTSANSSNTFGDTDIAALSYFVGSGSGVASSTYSGNLAINATREGFRQFSIGVDWLNGDFLGASRFTAGAKATIRALGEDFNVLDKAADIGTSARRQGWGPLDSTATSGRDCIDFDALDLFVVSAGGSLCLDQNLSWTLGMISGTFQATMGAFSLTRDFSIGGGRSALVDFDLPSTGYWDFSLTSLSLSGTMSSKVDADACALIDVIGFDPFRFGCTKITAYSMPTVSLNYAGKTSDVNFRAYIPEPTSMALMAAALAGLRVTRRRKTLPQG